MKNIRILMILTGLLACAGLFVSCGKQSASSAPASWPFTLEEVQGDATLETDRVTIVFEGESYENRSTGSLQVGSSSEPKQTTAGELETQYADGVCTVTFRGHTFKLLDGGNKLSIQGTDVELSDAKKVVTVKQDGSVTAKDK